MLEEQKKAALEWLEQNEAAWQLDKPINKEQFLSNLESKVVPMPAAKDVLNSLLSWAKKRRSDEVDNRPDQNIHKRNLEITWNQVITKIESEIAQMTEDKVGVGEA